VKNHKSENTSIAAVYQQIREVLTHARSQAYIAVNTAMVQAYWNIGRIIVEEEQHGEQRAEYGKRLIDGLSGRLSQEFGKGFDKSNLWNMRAFYLAYPILDAVRRELSWTHYRLLLKVDRPEVRLFYMEECISAGWSTRQLEQKINSMYYERLLASRDREPVRREIHTLEPGPQPEDIIKDPYVLGFLQLSKNPGFLEKELETALIGRLTHQDLGQIQMYINYYTRELMNEGDTRPIGLILCTDKNEAVVRYTLPENNDQIFASRYKLYLPSEDELARELERERRVIEMEKGLAGDGTERTEPI